MVKPGAESFKARVLHVCDERDDVQSSEIRLCVLGAPFDLYAFDAQYHKYCNRNIKAASSRNKLPLHDSDEVMQELIQLMETDPSHIWTRVELHEMSSTPAINRKQLLAKLQSNLQDKLIKLDILGCASLLCFMDHLPSSIKLLKVEDNEEAVLVERLKNKIFSECQTFSKPCDYDFGQFRKSKVIENTSPTILSFVSSMVSHGNIYHTCTSYSGSYYKVIQSDLIKSGSHIAPQMWFKRVSNTAT